MDRRSKPREAPIHFELHRHLKNAIRKGFTYEGVTFSRVEPEYHVPNVGRADVVLFDDRDNPWLVVEAKKVVQGRQSRDVDPYSPKVVKQAAQYAVSLGAPYFATYNGEKLVLFQTYEAFKPLLERSSKYYRIRNMEVFAPELLQEIVRFKKGTATWDELDKAFIARLQVFHDRMSNKYFEATTEKVKETRFAAKYEYWIREQGWYYPSEKKKRLPTDRKFAEQAAYIVLNQIVFYKILEATPAYKEEKLLPLPIENLAALYEFLGTASKKIDFQAVFEQDQIFGEVQILGFQQELQDFVLELQEYDLTQFDSDVIGHIYQGIIPLEQRRALGSYYTPPQIVKLIVDLALDNPSARVLDPACGSGGFVVAAYHRLKQLRKEAQLSTAHEKIIADLFALDINRFPAHLTAINLALQDLSTMTQSVNVEIADFFNVNPGQQRLAIRTADITGEKSEEQSKIPSKVDVIVANPPYIPNQSGSGGIPNLSNIREHLKLVGAEDIPALADIYAYFFTHASEFLENGGRLGFITSDRWLMVDYGVQLRDFLLKNFRIAAIITFDAMAFEDALISTCISIMEKEKDSKKRSENTTKLLRLKQPMKHEDIIRLVHSEQEPNELIENATYRLVTKNQGELVSETKWHKFLFAPVIYFESVTSDRMTAVDNLATVSLGIMTGANEFFYREKDELKELGINRKYFAPLMKSVGQAESLDFGDKNTEWLVFDIHTWVEKAIAEMTTEVASQRDITEQVKAKFEKWGMSDVLEFIESGEREGIHKRSICAARKVWFDLGKLQIPPVIYPKEYWRNPFVFFNKDKLAIDQHLYGIVPKEGVDPVALAAILFSDFGTIFRETEGRFAGGEALTRNEITVREVKQMRVVDPRKLTASQLNKIKRAFTTLVEGEREFSEKKKQTLKKEIDAVLLSQLEMSNRVNELSEAVVELLDHRVQAGGIRKKVMVQKPFIERRIKLRGAEVIPTGRIDDFIQSG